MFVGLLCYSSFKIIKINSVNQFDDIKESITGYNRKLLFTFVQAQNSSLNNQIELITEEVEHMAYDKFEGGEDIDVIKRYLFNNKYNVIIPPSRQSKGLFQPRVNPAKK
jgi:hypothetical protein